MSVKHGCELYDINVILKEDTENPEEKLDAILEKIKYDFDVEEMVEEDGCPNIKMSVKMFCSWYHQDAYWDDYGGGTAEDEMKYSDMEPDELKKLFENTVRCRVCFNGL